MGQSDESEAHLRPLLAGDIAALADLWIASWQEAMPAIDFAARRDWIAAFVGTPAHETLVAEIAGRQAGFVTLEGGYLHQLVVARESKGRGLATVLLDAAKARAPSGLRLDVNQANARAVRFYEREGFRRIDEGVNGTSGLATWAMEWAPVASDSTVLLKSLKHIAYSKDALRTLSRMPAKTAKLIRDKIKQYAADPTSLANNVKSLKGSDGVLRLRVGDWRVLFTEEGEVIAIIRIAPRGSAYD